MIKFSQIHYSSIGLIYRLAGIFFSNSVLPKYVFSFCILFIFVPLIIVVRVY